jgi:hypothetical protein
VTDEFTNGSRKLLTAEQHVTDINSISSGKGANAKAISNNNGINGVQDTDLEAVRRSKES